jgi:hypothetical protein
MMSQESEMRTRMTPEEIDVWTRARDLVNPPTKRKQMKKAKKANRPMTRGRGGVAAREVAAAKPAISFEKKKSMKLAALWSAIWECSQYMTTEEIQDHALAVLREIEADGG